MKLWPRSKTLRELRGRVEDQMVALWNRNQLIADQDQMITELRREIKSMASLLWEFVENTDEHKSATMFILHRAVSKIEKPVNP